MSSMLMKRMTAIFIAGSLIMLTGCKAAPANAGASIPDTQKKEQTAATQSDTETEKMGDAHKYEIVIKNVPLYLNGKETMDFELAFIDGNTDVPYISVAYAAGFMEGMGSDRAPDYQLTTEADGDTITMKRENGYEAVFDCKDDVIGFPDYDAFLITSASPTLMNLMQISFVNQEGQPQYFETDDNSYKRYGEVLTLRPGDYGIDLVHQDEDYYIPLQLLNDFFLEELAIQLLYNGESLCNGIDGNEENYYAVTPPKERSSQLADFSYRELCFALDSLYGLKAQHDIDDFDTLCMQAGLDEDLRGTDPAKYEQALSDLLFFNLDDGHSGYLHHSWMVKDNPEKNRGFSMLCLKEDLERYQNSRDAFYPDGCPGYEEIGNTAYITFDKFVLQMIDYYTEDAKDHLDDTMGLLIYAFSQITREGSPVENVVLDLSLNTGGAFPAAAYTLGMCLGDATISVKDILTEALETQNFKADLNLDRKFDDKDNLKDYHLFCLTSSNSFSCGNLVPCELAASHRVTMLGQTSGGGSCVVRFMTTADGTEFQISGSIRMSYNKNGSFYDIDQGVAPDYVIPTPDQFYDREYLTGYINDLLKR